MPLTVPTDLAPLRAAVACCRLSSVRWQRRTTIVDGEPVTKVLREKRWCGMCGSKSARRACNFQWPEGLPDPYFKDPNAANRSAVHNWGDLSDFQGGRGIYGCATHKVARPAPWPSTALTSTADAHTHASDCAVLQVLHKPAPPNTEHGQIKAPKGRRARGFPRVTAPAPLLHPIPNPFQACRISRPMCPPVSA